MAEYIERESAYEDFEKCNSENPKWTPSRVKTLIARQEAVDAVPVIRCRECKHCDPENYHCDHPMGTAAPLRREPDDFCSYGERKEGADRMDVREKLVELLQVDLSGSDGYEPELIADYMLDHGVTVQEWISVDERLPENFISVLGYMTDAGEFPPVRECYTVGNEFFFPALGDVHPVSHWCELPQPPRGE